MTCARGTKRFAGFLFKESSTYGQLSRSYGSQAFRVGQLVKAREGAKLPLSLMLSRRLSAAASTSEQMNLIRQLREKTSAPIKDVKSSLISCNWDIGA